MGYIGMGHVISELCYKGTILQMKSIFVWFCLMLYVPVYSYGHVGMVSSLNYRTFFVDKLNYVVNQYFLHILLLVTDTL